MDSSHQTFVNLHFVLQWLCVCRQQSRMLATHSAPGPAVHFLPDAPRYTAPLRLLEEGVSALAISFTSVMLFGAQKSNEAERRDVLLIILRLSVCTTVRSILGKTSPADKRSFHKTSLQTQDWVKHSRANKSSTIAVKKPGQHGNITCVQ